MAGNDRQILPYNFVGLKLSGHGHVPGDPVKFTAAVEADVDGHILVTHMKTC